MKLYQKKKKYLREFWSKHASYVLLKVNRFTKLVLKPNIIIVIIFYWYE